MLLNWRKPERRKGEQMKQQYQAPALLSLYTCTEAIMADFVLGSNETGISDLLNGIGDVSGV